MQERIGIQLGNQVDFGVILPDPHSLDRGHSKEFFEVRMKRLEGKRVLVTGAGAGIGEHICYRFAAEGAVIAGMDRNERELTRVAGAMGSQGHSMVTMTGDVTSEADCEAAVNGALTELGGIDVLCNIAGIVDGGTLLEADQDSWDRSHNVNVRGLWWISKRVVPHMVEQGGGSIINMASVAGPFGVPNRGVYSVTKNGVIGITKSLAIDFVGQGVRVNAICPGTVESPSWHERVNQAPDPEQMLKDFIARQPMGRVGQPEEIAALAAYLASDESSYMTGQAITLDGGMTL